MTLIISPSWGRDSAVAPTRTFSGAPPSTQCPAVSTTFGATSVPVHPWLPEKYTAVASGHLPAGADDPPITGAEAGPARAVIGRASKATDSAYRMGPSFIRSSGVRL